MEIKKKQLMTIVSDMIDFMDLKIKGFVVFDQNKEIIKFNQRFLEIFQLEVSEDLNRDIQKIAEKFGINKETEFIYNDEDYQINIQSKGFDISEETSLFFWIFELVDDKSIRRSLLEAIVQYSQDGIHAVDLNGNMIVYNEAQGKIDNYNPEDALNKKLVDIYVLNEESSLLLKVLKTQKPIENTRQGYYTRAGSFVDCVTNVIPLFHHGKIFGSAAIVRDYSSVLNSLNITDIRKNQNTPKSRAPIFEKRQTRYCFEDIITGDPKFLKTIEGAKAASNSKSNILIIGETGTGKEMFAQSIHAYSNRDKNPFVAINCAAIPETLLEGLLFGTSKGAFTGALDKPGLFEEANGGTVFLDEINSMSLFLQAKLLRVLEERTVTRLGSNKIIHIDARIISSCNENPGQKIKENSFRSDLFYRLAVVYLVIPSLRTRKEDILLLSDYFIRHYNKILEKNIITISEDVKVFFLDYHWPGNVRQLRHLLESAMNIIPENKETIEISDLPNYIIPLEEEKKTKEELENKTEKDNKILENHQGIFEALKTEEKMVILETLKHTQGNIAKAAEKLGMSRQKLYYKLKKYKIK